MIIHCYAGISRSTAAAFIDVVRAQSRDAGGALIARRLREASPAATPNRRHGRAGRHGAAALPAEWSMLPPRSARRDRASPRPSGSPPASSEPAGPAIAAKWCHGVGSPCRPQRFGELRKSPRLTPNASGRRRNMTVEARRIAFPTVRRTGARAGRRPDSRPTPTWRSN